MKNILKDIDKAYLKIKEAYQEIFPDYKKIFEETVKNPQLIKELKDIEDKIKWKYRMYRLMMVAFMILFMIALLELLIKDILTAKNLYFNIQIFSFLFEAIGVYILSNGLIKNNYQIMLESSTYLGYNKHNLKERIITKYDTQFGLSFIFFGIALNILGAFLSLIF